MRLPDGSCKTHHFPAQSPLSDLYSFVRTDTNYTSFSLSTSFPRRNLDTEDKAATLKDLQMAPSCTVMVLPSSTLASHNGDFMSLVWLLLTPFTILWGIISTFIGTAGGTREPTPQSGSTNTTSSSSSSSSGGENRARAGAGTHKVTREAGIGRLRNTDFSDDENNTWNGNSTQQK